MDYSNHYESFSRRIFGHLMRLDQLLVRETNVMDYSHLYLFFAIIQLLFFELWITITVMVRKSNSPYRLTFSQFLHWKVNQIIIFFTSRSNSTRQDRFVLHLTHNMD